MRLTALVVLMMTFLTRPLLAQDQVSTFELDNGLEIVVIEDHRAPVVVHMLWYRAGSADEDPGHSGIAHFLEHLLFKATDTLEAGEFSATVARNGGRDNAFTSYDYTAYFQRIAADRLDLMMQMESDRMVNIRITEEDVETERGVVIEERNQRTENNPSALFREQANAAQYMNHRYGAPIIGYRHEIDTLSLQDAMDFYKANYAPNNAILVVAGDVKPDEVLALAQKHYGPIPANPDLEDRVRSQEPPQRAERRIMFEDARVAQPYLTRSYLVPERDPGDQDTAAALTMLAEILGAGVTSFLHEKLQFDQQIAVHSAAYYRGLTVDDTTFSFVVAPTPDVSLEDAETALDQAVADFIETGVDPEQLARIKTQIRADQIYARDDVGALANRYGRALASGLTVQDVQDWPERLQAVTPDDIMTAATTLLNRDNAVTGYVQAPKAQ